ncbi:hypothetical protein MK489_25110, partial [Myxococcota bacterium]|nr:hypothetical protein [Myxococcota bacterium]
MKASNFLDIYRELIDENPFAARAVLKILEIEFTHEIPTLAVTQGDKPRLLVNLGFLQAHCHTDEHVKAVICHEFLHVLLRHTEREATPTPAWNLALDAVINAIIHRSLGTQYSSMMSTFYKDAQGPELLLRPPQAPILKNTVDLTWQEVASWEALYEGNLTASDIHEIARDFKHRDLPAVDRLLGSHEANSEPNAGSHEANSKPNAGSHEANSEPNAESPEAEPPSTDLNAALDRVREYLSGNGR